MCQIHPDKLIHYSFFLANVSARSRLGAQSPNPLRPGRMRHGARSGRRAESLKGCPQHSQVGSSRTPRLLVLPDCSASNELGGSPASRASGDPVRRIGLEARTVSAGRHFDDVGRAGLPALLTEHRAGTSAFLDRSVDRTCAGLDYDCALTVLTTVVSRSTPGRAIIDAGSKCLSSDAAPVPGYGQIAGASSSDLTQVDEEHGYVTVGAGDLLAVGQRVRIVPNHACAVVNLFDRLHVVRAGRVTAIWPIAARGRST